MTHAEPDIFSRPVVLITGTVVD